jgi:hypothetical protein
MHTVSEGRLRRAGILTAFRATALRDDGRNAQNLALAIRGVISQF